MKLGELAPNDLALQIFMRTALGVVAVVVAATVVIFL